MDCILLGDSSDVQGCQTAPSLTPLIDFGGAETTTWNNEEKELVRAGAWKVAWALYTAGGGQFSSPREAFLAVYGGTVTFWKTGTYQADGALGFAKSKNEILVYKHDTGSVISEGKRWVAHELGHAFNKALYPNTTDNSQYGQGVIDLATADIGYTNEDGVYTPLAGGCTASTYLTSCYVRKSGEGAGYVDEFNLAVDPSEDFADMFSGYVFGFADNDAGRARYDWMDSQWSAWINLAVTNNNR